MESISKYLKLNIARKLLFGIIIMLMLIGVITSVALFNINKVKETANEILEESIEYNAIQKLKTNFQQFQKPVNDYLINGNTAEYKIFEEALEEVKAQGDICMILTGNRHEKTFLNKFEVYLTEMEMLAQSIMSIEKPVGNPEGAKIMKVMDVVSDKAIDSIDETMAEALREMDEYIETNRNTNTQSRRIILICSLIISLFLLIGGYLYVKGISKLTRTIKKVSSGEFFDATKESTHDEIGNLADSFKNMIKVMERTTVSRDYFNNVLSSMIDTLMITDAEGMITFVNRPLLDLLGYAEKEMIGQPVAMVLSENANDVISLHSERIKEMTEKGLDLQAYYNYFSKGKKEIAVSISSSLMYGKDGLLTGMICIASPSTKHTKERNSSVLENDNSETPIIGVLGAIPLTDREREITKLIAQELTNQDIADKLAISIRTVETHRKNIMRKLQIKSVIALVKYASQNKII